MRMAPDFRGNVVREVGNAYLAGYELQDVIGQGGQAIVYQAVDLSEPSEHDRLVAVKLMQPFPDEQQTKAFQTEGHRTTKWRHGNVLPTYFFGLGRIDDDPQAEYPITVMPLIENGSIADRVTKVGRLPLAETVLFVGQAADGLQYAHERGTLHRDVKPNNLLLASHRRGLEIKVADFGIAVNLHEADSKSVSPQARVGTYAYAAPEQLDGQAVRQSDIYSLAVTTYELAAGKKPFTKSTAAGLIRAHLLEPPQSFDQTGIIMSQPLEAIESVVMQGLAKRPQNRQPTIGDYGQDLRDAYEHGRVQEAKATTTIDLGADTKKLLDPAVGRVKIGPEDTKEFTGSDEEWLSLYDGLVAEISRLLSENEGASDQIAALRALL